MLLFAGTGLAADPITGGFGLRLGAPLDAGRVESTEQLADGRTVHQVSPPNRRPPFREYRVYSNRDNVIHTIEGRRQFRLMSSCRAAGNPLSDQVTQRHGDPVENLLGQGGPTRWAREARAIVVTCEQGKDGVTLQITYTDSVLALR